MQGVCSLLCLQSVPQRLLLSLSLSLSHVPAVQMTCLPCKLTVVYRVNDSCLLKWEQRFVSPASWLLMFHDTCPQPFDKKNQTNNSWTAPYFSPVYWPHISVCAFFCSLSSHWTSVRSLTHSSNYSSKGKWTRQTTGPIYRQTTGQIYRQARHSFQTGIECARLC